MEQRGHTDARLTLRVYTRAMCQSPQERDLRKALFDGLIGAPTGSRAGFCSADASHGTAPKPASGPFRPADRALPRADQNAE